LVSPLVYNVVVCPSDVSIHSLVTEKRGRNGRDGRAANSEGEEIFFYRLRVVEAGGVEVAADLSAGMDLATEVELAAEKSPDVI
jgi:hypothetical protein